MKKIILCLLLGFGFNVKAQDHVEIVSVKKVILPVDLRLVKLWYDNYSGESYVAIIVPELVKEALLNHKDEIVLPYSLNSNKPFLFTKQINHINDLIQNRLEIVRAPFEIVLKKKVYQDLYRRVCEVYLTEEIKTEVRRINFTHSQSVSLPDIPLDDCRINI